MKREEFEILLECYLAKLRSDGGAVYLLQQLHEGGMTNAKFHKLAKDWGGDAYDAIYDILEGRIIEKVTSGEVDREIGKMMLRSFYNWDRKDGGEKVGSGVVIRLGEEEYGI